MTLFAFDEWRVAYATADEVSRTQIETNTLMYDSLWDAMYVLLLLGFGIGNLALGIAMSRGRGLSRIVGYFFFGACVLTLANLLPELGGPMLPEAVATWLYALIQPAGRVLIGAWLWLYAVDERG